MTKLTVNPTPSPSQNLVKAAAAEFTVTDSRGRVIKLAKPTILEQFRFVEALGDAANNETYRRMAMPVQFVRSIRSEENGEDLPAPMTTKREIEHLIQRLGEDGFDAVSLGILEHYGVDMADTEAAKKKSEL
jgi:hypothetical protein